MPRAPKPKDITNPTDPFAPRVLLLEHSDPLLEPTPITLSARQIDACWFFFQRFKVLSKLPRGDKRVRLENLIYLHKSCEKHMTKKLTKAEKLAEQYYLYYDR